MKKCCHCGIVITRSNSTLDHVPSKCFLEKPFPKDVNTVRICKRCNASFSRDEEYVAAFLGFLLWDENSAKVRLSKVIESNWALDSHFIDDLKVTNDCKIYIEPDEARIEKIISKNAVGHLHTFTGGGAPLAPPDSVKFAPLESIPEFYREFLFGPDQGWTISQEAKYRFLIIEQRDLLVRSVIHEYLATEAIWKDFLHS